DRRQAEREAGTEDGRVDTLLVEDAEALVRAEAGGVAVGVATAAPEVDERRARVAEPDEPAVGDAPVLDPRLVEARLRVPAEPNAALAERRGERARPQVGRLAHVAVGIDDELPHRAHC